MTQYQDDSESRMYQPYEEEKPQRSWLGRNWLWFVPTLILLPIFCCCGGGGLLIYFGLGMAFDAPPYKDSIALAGQNAEVQNAIGTPIESPQGFIELVAAMDEGGDINYEINNNQAVFTAVVPLIGPNGAATLKIDAQSTDGGTTWTYTTQEVELTDGTVIDLITPSSRSPNEDSEKAARDRDIDAAVDAIKQSLDAGSNES